MNKKKQIIFSSLLGIVLLVVIFIPKNKEAEPLDEVEVTDSVEVKEIVYKYGIPVDDYDVDYGFVKRNQSLSTILEKHGLSIREVYLLARRRKGFLMSAGLKADRHKRFFPPGIVCRRQLFLVMKKIPVRMSVLIFREVTR